ncbi:KAP family P-loop NTPase fold protein [Microbacterium caowuchunii]|uniref:KAP NTPase domain-containing protein n=1 Tax=Microbacterium caowuchunii TaxID=2614638 RepID=A0A5N0TG81_9MICO|nr:P-loop NTPase fold protein [Microbacterium caowuchunii]KAA9133611.1 hypothetical protein F6B40_09410 [Microbacterium caowuchunii]
MAEPHPSDWYTDEAVGAPDDDALDRGKFVQGLERVLNRLYGNKQSSVLSLIGSWGSGKSSVLSQLVSKLEQRPEGSQWITIPFNPWYYQDLASLQTGFFRELRSAVPTGPSWRGVRESIAGLGRAVAPFGGLLSVVGFDGSKVIDGFSELIESDQGVASQRRAAENALAKVDSPVLVVVDDVDRLDPPELLLLFKLIRLVGRLPNIHYLLAYDEMTLLDALSRTGLVGADDPRRPIDYLEKIVQVRLDMPPVREEQLSTWVDSSLERLAQDHGLEFDDEASRRFSSAYFAHIRQRLATPRSIKRYLAQVDAFLAGLVEEVDLVDFLIISWIRSAEPLVYRALIANRGRLLGDFSTSSVEWARGNRDVSAEHQYWREMLEGARVSPENIEGVASLLGQLFPRFEHQWSKRNYSYRGDSVGVTRIAHQHYFDRYFAFAVPAEDLPDQVVHAAYEQIIAGDPGPEIETVEAQLPNRADLVLTKLESRTVLGTEDSVKVARWLTKNFHRLPENRAIADSRQRARWFGGRVYSALNPVQRIEVFEEAKLTLDGLSYLTFLSHAAAAQAGDQLAAPADPVALDPADRALAASIGDHLYASIGEGPLQIKDETWSLFWALMRLDLASARKFVWKGLDEHDWEIIDLAARFVSVSIYYGKSKSRRVGEFDLESLGKVVDLPILAARVGVSPEDATVRLEHELPATKENRRLVARRGIAQWFVNHGMASDSEPTKNLTAERGVPGSAEN